MWSCTVIQLSDCPTVRLVYIWQDYSSIKVCCYVRLYDHPSVRISDYPTGRQETILYNYEGYGYHGYVWLVNRPTGPFSDWLTCLLSTSRIVGLSTSRTVGQSYMTKMLSTCRTVGQSDGHIPNTWRIWSALDQSYGRIVVRSASRLILSTLIILTAVDQSDSRTVG